MLFNSLEFLIFLPVVFCLYWFVFKPLRWQNLLVVIASCVFYGWWDWRFLLLISLTTICSYLSGLLLEKFAEAPRRTRLGICLANAIINLIILGFFKYFNFFADNFAALLTLLGFQVNPYSLRIILPVGISFYTFQALSYTIDVYRKTFPPTRDFIAFAAFITFFPLLVAGPIERASNLLPQFARKRAFDYATAVDGCRQILWGFFKKVIIADNCAQSVNYIWSGYESHGTLALLTGAILFSFQIYGDFSGYSDIALGVSKLFGIRAMRNFNTPYFSRDIAEFWRRWHISLTTWFRDYVYIPLGGSRCSSLKAFRNTLVIFLVSGFWHGAAWTFIAWGLYHALLFFPLLFFGKNRKYRGEVAPGRLLPPFHDAARMLMTFLLVMFGWIIFRSESISQAAAYIIRIFSPSAWHWTGLTGSIHLLIALGIMLMAEWLQRGKEHPLQNIETAPVLRLRSVRRTLYLTLCLCILFFAGGQTQFIYFQF